MSGFFQDGPVLGNQYLDDKLLRTYMKRHLPVEAMQEIEPDLIQFGERVIGDVKAMADLAEAQPPDLVQYDEWGRRADRVRVSQGWRDLDKVAAEEGLVAIGYEREYGEYSRLYQFAKLYLFVPSSAIYACPLAMTDGAAKLIETYGDALLREQVLPRLTSRDPARFWTSGQWMTERTGGSDVGESETVAECAADGFHLYGDKFFTSAVTAQMAMTLARIKDDESKVVPGSRGLSLFYVKAWNDDGTPNNLRINRLKDKLGTRALPTAEITLDGTPARLVGEAGRGVKNISTLFNVTRIYNTCSAVAYMRRGLALAKDYAPKRRAFGKALCDLPLHMETLAQLETEFAGSFLMSFRLAELLGREEAGKASAAEVAVLRLLTPLAKLFTGKIGVALASEILESFGGAGYMEDTGIPILLRQAQTLSIWEGTTNVLALDAVRAIEREGAYQPFAQEIRQRIAGINTHPLVGAVDKVGAAIDALDAYVAKGRHFPGEIAQAEARQFAYALSRTYIASLLLDHAQWASTGADGEILIEIAMRWTGNVLVDLPVLDGTWVKASKAIGLW